MIHRLLVGVALHRPPKIDELRAYTVEAGDYIEATEIALQMAFCTSVMPVCTGQRADNWPKEWFR